MALNIAAFVIWLSAVFLISCSKGDEAGSTETTATIDSSVVSPRPAPTSDPGLESALLSVEDLGQGWQRESIEGATVAKDYYCGVELASAVPSALTVVFSLDEATLVIQGASAHETEKSAIEEMAAERRAADGCSDYVSTDGVASTSYKIELADFPSFGDESNSFRATEIDESQVEQNSGYQARIRYGTLIMLLSVSGLPGEVDTSRAVAIFELADDKFRDYLANSAE